MDARLNPTVTVIGPKAVKHLVSADHALAGSTLPRSTRDLVKIRASQINGCGACLDMHVKEALAAGRTRCASVSSLPGARRRSSRRRSAPHSSSRSRARGSPTSGTSPTRRGRPPRSTTTRSSSPPWSASSRSSTPSTGST
ncbi:carboxymuconolactone decarboxylase family protein [Luteimicrobium album]|uniref:carboxymuconolactone decarboxylase family protein n=1 Tax=Luteimicrobium album TaxID=1054550 RepID=UPI0024E05759|nr:carboxymuconolactone decarboxylase family protein [Luteimicrobium album]